MQITILSVATIVMAIMKCHLVIDLPWWAVLSPAALDAFINFVKWAEARRRRHELFEFLFGDKGDGDDE